MTVLIRQFSLIEAQPPSDKKGASIVMQELIQSIVASQISNDEKKKLMASAAQLLKGSFTQRSDHNVAAILKDNKPLLNTLRLSREADQIGYHTEDLTQIRIRCFDVLLGMIRDIPAVEELMGHLERDFQHKVKVGKEDEVLYYANLALYEILQPNHYEKALLYGRKALELAEATEGSVDERLRILSNLIQLHVFMGHAEETKAYIDKGERIVAHCKSDAYRALFLLAKNAYLLDQAAFQSIIETVRTHTDLLARQTDYPSMRYFILSQLSEALFRQGALEEARRVALQAERIARDVHGDKDEHLIFGKLSVLKGTFLMNDISAFETARTHIEKGIAILDAHFKGPDKHRGQALAHVRLGQLLHATKRFQEARAQYYEAEKILEKLLREKRVDDLSLLYAQLALLGIDSKDEALTQRYLKKHIETFGYEHARTKEVLWKLVEQGLVVVI